MTTNKRGIGLLQDPSLNKSTAFTEAEKEAFGIGGLVPDVTETEDLQLSRVMMQLGHKNTDLERYIYLINLLGHNETLFYRTLMSDPARFLPIVYDPDHRGSVSQVRPYLPAAARHIPFDYTPRQREGGLEKLAAERRSVHLRH